MRLHLLRIPLFLIALVWGSAAPVWGAAVPALFPDGQVLKLGIEIPEAGLATLRQYRQVWGQPRPQRVDVQVTVREGGHVYTNVALHLKGSFTFQRIDDKPSLTLNFDKFAPGQRFHDLDKLHLNNSVQDPSFMCEVLARELFIEAGVPAARAGHARVSLNGKDLGPYVAIEGATKRFLKRYFRSVRGNLYDGGSGGDITKKLQADSGENRENRSDIEGLLAAARETNSARRVARLEQVLDVERFLTFAALEVLFQHWDGYCLGPNNYRLFHDMDQDRMVFMPHGLDQLLGVGHSPETRLTPHWDGVVARGLFSTPEGRRRYLERVSDVFTNHFRLEVLTNRVERMAARLRPGLVPGFIEGMRFRAAVDQLKGRLEQRVESVSKQMVAPEQPLRFGADGTATLSRWEFKAATQRRATGQRLQEKGRDLLEVRAAVEGSSGAWRTSVLLEPGRYEFVGQGRAVGVAEGATNSGVILRVSGERSVAGLSTSQEWVGLDYPFEVQGMMVVELVCEFRGSEGKGCFDARTLQLRRRR